MGGIEGQPILLDKFEYFLFDYLASINAYMPFAGNT